MCVYLTRFSRGYGEIFRNLSLQILTPYEGIISSISFKEGRRVSCFVHAEIQFVTFYGLNPNIGTKRPRILGVSKASCYLCSLFLLIQGQYFVTQSHSHLYDQWNVPDLATYGPNQVREYHRVLARMGQKIRKDLLRARKSGHNRRYPLTSSVHLPKNPQLAVSPLSSDIRTLISDVSSSPNHIKPTDQNPSQPLVVPREQPEAEEPPNRFTAIRGQSSPPPYRLPSPLVNPKLAQPSSVGTGIPNTVKIPQD